MADPLSMSASVLAITTAAIQSTKSLYETVGRYRDRDKRLQRLQDELKDLTAILTTLEEVTQLNTSMLPLLEAPVARCSQLCGDFEKSMKAFSEKSTLGIRDWAKLEFMRGDINDFLDTLTGYKSTLSVGLGTVTMQISRLSQDVLENYHEMIKDTTYSLELHLQRVDEKMAKFTLDDNGPTSAPIDLTDEKAVTQQCLVICENARSFLASLKVKAPSLQGHISKSDPTRHNQFEAQDLTCQALDRNRESLAETIGRLTERLSVLDPGRDSERLRLQQEIDTSRQCLELCKMASSQVSSQKIYKLGEAVADGDSDQVVVSTMADLFDVKKALSRGKSAQLIGFMSEESLQQLSRDRYSSRFGAMAEPQATVPPSAIPSATSTDTSQPHPRFRGQKPTESATRGNRPAPNEIRKRTANEDVVNS